MSRNLSTEELGILSDAVVSRQPQYKAPCPWCSPNRRKNKEPCLSVQVTGDNVLYNCWHCQTSGKISLSEKEAPMKVQGIVSVEQLPLTDQHLDWLHARGFSDSTIKRAGLFSTVKFIPRLQREVPTITFPYMNGDQIYACKHRGPDKTFVCTGAPSTLWGIESLTNDAREIIIVEGEADRMAFMEAGYENVVSIPNGAVGEVKSTYDRDNDRKFNAIWEAMDVLNKMDRIILALDNDKPGQATSEEIARRIGKARCWKVTWPDGCKDANDVLLAKNVIGLRMLVDQVSPYPVDGLFPVSEYRNSIIEVLRKGLPKGHTTGYAEVDDVYTILPGQVTIVTGVPGHGKSEFIDQLMINVAEHSGWSFAVCSFENDPVVHATKLIAKRLRRALSTPVLGQGPDAHPRAELESALDWISRGFYFISGETDGSLTTLDSILDRIKCAIQRYGIRGAVIDPYNYIVKSKDCTETDWVSDMLSRICAFAKAFDIHIWFVAHPTKMETLSDGNVRCPVGYDISGSAAWFAKADIGLTVYRPANCNDSKIVIWKARHSWIGKVGHAWLRYNPATSSYEGVYTDQF